MQPKPKGGNNSNGNSNPEQPRRQMRNQLARLGLGDNRLTLA